MDRMIPFWLPFGVLTVIAVIVVSIGETFLRVSHNMALGIGIAILVLITVVSFALAGTGSNAESH